MIVTIILAIALVIFIGICISLSSKNAELKAENKKLESSNEYKDSRVSTLNIDIRHLNRHLVSEQNDLFLSNKRYKDLNRVYAEVRKENKSLKSLIDPSSGHDESNSTPSGRPIKKKISLEYTVDDILSEIDKVGISKVSKDKLAFLRNQSKD